jgi:hypothetical protein
MERKIKGSDMQGWIFTIIDELCWVKVKMGFLK